jgi:hypothetical protein
VASRVARFRVRAHLDGRTECMVQIRATAGGDDAVVFVRPLRSRMKYSWLLSDVVLMVAMRHVKALQAKGRSR